MRTFGISVEPSWRIDYATEISILAERLKFSNIWVPDSGPNPPYSDSIVTLASIAASTSRVMFGSAIVNFYTKNPASIASSFLALSDLGKKKGGKRQRAIVGIGVGSDWTVGKYGIANRNGMIAQLREAVESIRELFNGKLVDTRTDSFAIVDVSLSKATAKIPIYIGSNSPRGLELAGEVADGVILTDRIPDDIDESLSSVSLGLSRASRKRREFKVVDSVVVSVDSDKNRARRVAAPTCAYLVSWLSDEKAAAHQIDLQTKAKISNFIRVGDEVSAAKLVDNRMIDLMTATGNIDDVVQKCDQYLSYDTDQLAFCEPFGRDVKESIALLARKVIPRL